MSDWPDINSPDFWEQKPKDPKDPKDPKETENGRLTALTGGSWSKKDIDVIKWMTNVKPPRWAMWKKS